MVRRSPPRPSRCVAKEWRSACGVAVSGKLSADAQFAHLALDDRRLQRRRRAHRETADPADRDGTGRAGGIPRWPCGRSASTGTSRVLPPLPVTRMTPSRASARSAADQPQRLGNAQAGAVEQRQHGGVARRDPRLVGKLLAGRNDAPGIAGGQRLGQRFRLFRRAQGGRARRIGKPAPLEIAQQRAHPGEPASRACAPRRHRSAGWPGRRAGRPAAAGRHRRGRARRRDGRSGNAGTAACRAHRRRASAPPAAVRATACSASLRAPPGDRALPG